MTSDRSAGTETGRDAVLESSSPRFPCVVRHRVAAGLRAGRFSLLRLLVAQRPGSSRTGRAWALLLAVALGCGRGDESPPPVVELDGCQEVRFSPDGDVCVLRDSHRLTAWAEPPAGGAPIDLEADGRSLEPETRRTVAGGVRLEIIVPAGTRRLTVAGQSFALEPSPWPEDFKAAVRAVSKQSARARELFAGCPESLGPSARPACFAMLAKSLPLSAERDAAIASALAGHRAAGHRLGEVDALALAVDAAVDRGDLAAARRLLAELPPPPLPGRAAFLATYSRGRVARKGGAVDTALEQIGEAAALAAKVGRSDDLRDAEQILALTLEEIGRFESAAQIFTRLVEEAAPQSPCKRAELWNNLGWTRYLAREQGEPVADPMAPFDHAAAELARASCPIDERFNVQVNRAVALLQAGRTGEVPAALAAAESHLDAANAEQKWWFGMAEAGLALARGNRQAALERYDELARLEVPEAEWRARFGRALALGAGPAALEALSEVEDLLDRRLANIPAGEGREWFIAQSEPIVRRRLALLLDRGETAAALELVRRARARVLRGFAAPAAGETRETLADPAPGELLLAYHPLNASHWIAFAEEHGRPPRAVPIAAPPASLTAGPEIAALLLGPFEPEIERARRLRVLPYGRLRDLDFHALPQGRDPLVARRPVVYGLDLPARSRLRGTGKALVVGDPRDDLPQAAREAQEVYELLRRTGREVELLVGLDATAENVLQQLAEGVEILHFAGHADFSGPGGWQSELRLARGTRLTLEDLLALERAPEWVVLSACESGKTSSGTRVDGLGLAQTFLVGGSRAVVATSRPIADEVARPLVTELYRAWIEGGDLAAALATAQVRRGARGDWAAFRVIER